MTLEEWHKLPGNKPKPKKVGHIGEKKVLKACLHWLAIHKILHRRQNTGAYETKDKYGNPRWIQYGEAGAGDIVGATRTGRYFEIEAKASDGKQTALQLSHQAKVEKTGGLYIVAKSTDDLHLLLTQ